VRLEQTLYAEHPEKKPWIEKQRGEKTLQTPETLAAIWNISEAENLSIYGRFWGSGGFPSRRIQQWDLILCGSTNGWERERGAFRNIGRAGRAGADWGGGAEASHGGAAPGRVAAGQPGVTRAGRSSRACGLAFCRRLRPARVAQPDQIPPGAARPSGGGSILDF